MKSVKVRTKNTFVGADFSAQEPRLTAFLSQDPKMVKAFQEGRDLYSTLGTGVWNNDYWDNMEYYEDGSPNVEGKARRKKCKTLLLGLSYGMGDALTAQKMGVSTKEAKEIIEKFFASYPKMKEFINNNELNAQKQGYVEDAWGRKRRLPDATLPDYEFETVKYNTGFNPLLDTSGDVYIDRSKEFKAVENQLSSVRSAKERAAVKDQALKNNIKVRDNGAFISRAARQSTNARIQGCLSPDTKIITQEYGIVDIADVVNTHLHVWDGDIWSEADVVSSGSKQLCNITLSSGQIFKCSPDHLFKVVKLIHDTKNQCTRQSVKFVKCKDLKPGTRICINSNYAKQKFAESIDAIADQHCFGRDTVIVKAVELTDTFIDMYDVCDTQNGYFIADGLVVHNSAASMTKRAMINIYNDKIMNDLGFKLLIGVHDELIGECPIENAEKCGERLSYLMSTCVSDTVHNVPFKCDCEIEDVWYENSYQHQLQKDYNDLLKSGMEPEIALRKIQLEHEECLPDKITYLLNKED